MRLGFICAFGAVLLGGQSIFATSLYGVDGQSTVITSIEQADALVRATQEQFVFLFPPSSDSEWIYVHPDRTMRPVIWSSGWPNKLKKQMYAEMRAVNGNLYPVYKIWAEADPLSGDLTYYNMYGQAVWTSSAPIGYTPLTPVLEHYNLSSEDELTESQKGFSASSIGLEFQLMPDEFVSSYEQDAVLEEQAVEMMSAEPMMAASTMSIPLPGDGTSTNGGGASSDPVVPVDYGDSLYIDQNLSAFEEGWLDIHNAVPGQAYEVYHTYNLQYIPFSTNAPNSATPWPAKTGLIAGTDGVAYWTAPLVGENALNKRVLFFKAYEAIDSDGDGLSDIYEIMITETSPANVMSIPGGVPDSDLDLDGDGFTNYEEYRGLGMDIYTHPGKPDSDNDGKNDDVDPWPMDKAGKADTDGDRMPDDLNAVSTSYPQLVADPDDDNDLLSDEQEALMETDAKDRESPGALVWLDSDSDGLFDWQDPYPNDPDGDNDGIGDGYEELVLTNSATVHNGYSASETNAYFAISGDPDGDGRPQWQESRDSTNPADGLDFNVNVF